MKLPLINPARGLHSSLPATPCYSNNNLMWLGERPDLAHQHAFDMCATSIRSDGGAVGVVSLNLPFAREMLKRLESCAVKLSTPNSLKPRSHTPFQSLVWIDPWQEDAFYVLPKLQQLLAPQGRIYVICQSRLLRLARARDIHSTSHPLTIQHMVRTLRHNGFRIEQRCGFLGMKSLVWAVLERLCLQLKRDDLADRCHFAMREAYVVPGWSATSARVGLVQAVAQ